MIPQRKTNGRVEPEYHLKEVLKPSMIGEYKRLSDKILSGKPHEGRRRNIRKAKMLAELYKDVGRKE